MTEDIIINLFTAKETHSETHQIVRTVATSDEINGIEYQNWCVECDNWLEFVK